MFLITMHFKTEAIFETECFFNLFLEVFQLQLEQLEFKLEKNEIQKQTEKVSTLSIF